VKHKIIAKILDLLEKSVLVQGSIALAFVLTICIMGGMHIAIPPLIEYGTILSLGFFFGAKSNLSNRQEN
jgi:hypothetical protein